MHIYCLCLGRWCDVVDEFLVASAMFEDFVGVPTPNKVVFAFFRWLNLVADFTWEGFPWV